MLVAGPVAMPTAADTTAWFGTPPPPPVSDPRQPIMKYDDAFPPLPAQFAHRPGRSDELLDGAALKADQKKIVGFSLESLGAGDRVWGRRAGTPAFMHTIEWTVNALQDGRSDRCEGRDLSRGRHDVGAEVVARADRRATRRSAPARRT